MLMEPAIELHHVDKIHPLRPRSGRSLKGRILSFFRPPQKERFITAASDTNLIVQPGEALGLVGPNGAGKTTLLRLIAGITPPSKGKIITRGRIIPLLELSAGFHQELSGYENIFLQSALFGFGREEIKAILPAIVNFAELHDFIHTPVKHYSSGMTMRLGFAISVNLNPDILLVDEAFSVGDLYFQEKCIKKMRKLHEKRCTFILVAHDLDLIEEVCDRVLWIDQGRIESEGTADDVAQKYRHRMLEATYPHPAPLIHESQVANGQPGRFGRGHLTTGFFEFLDAMGKPCHSFENDEPLQLRIPYQVHNAKQIMKETKGSMEIDYIFLLQSKVGHGAGALYTDTPAKRLRVNPTGGEWLFKTDSLNLAPGSYTLTAMFYRGSKKDVNAVYDLHSRLYSFRVASRDDLSQVAGLDMPCEWKLTTP